MYNELTEMQKNTTDWNIESIEKISYPINKMLKESLNIYEFDFKINKYVNNINKLKKERGIPDIKEMGGSLYN